ncbi:MAG: pyridoxamine 5'-phosphate oxidase family protein [Betaproteobacteria bacterium]|nr:pyridoxamine 5'-phosphate oxidase family protein [Betaproteobacteria bacterium]
MEAFLDAQHVMSLATFDDSGPHAVSLMYARDGLTLCWTSDPTTRHSRHLERDDRAAVSIAPDYRDFRAIQGLQFIGLARRADDPRSVRALLERRYAFLAELSSGPPALRAALDKAGFYCFIPTRVTLIDNSRGFGHKEVLDLGKGGQT